VHGLPVIVLYLKLNVKPTRPSTDGMWCEVGSDGLAPHGVRMVGLATLSEKLSYCGIHVDVGVFLAGRDDGVGLAQEGHDVC